MSNRITTTPHNPTVPVAVKGATAGVSPAPSRRWGLRRRALVASLFVMALIAAVAGNYAWSILSALNNTQDSSIVALPTRSREVAVVVTTAMPTPTSALVAAPTATPRPTTAAGVSGTRTTRAEGSPDVAAPGTPEVETEAPPADPDGTNVASTSTEQTPLATDEELSRLDIAQIIVSASIPGDDPGRSSIWGGKTFIDVLVLGVDRRPDGGDQNSDVIFIARVDLIEEKISAVSLPRDLFVDVPGVYTGKINGAYNAGVAAAPDDRTAGVVVIRDTIEQLYGVYIDGYVMIDFDGFEEVIDAVGGIDITVPEAIVDEAYPTIDYGTERVEFKAGRQHMDGDLALKYVRTRNTDSDDARRGRQIDVLLALFGEAKGVGSIRRGDEIIVALGDAVQTGFDLHQQLTLARVARNMDQTDITLTTLEEPLISGGPNADGVWVYSSDPVEVAAFINETLESGSDSLTT